MQITMNDFVDRYGSEIIIANSEGQEYVFLFDLLKVVYYILITHWMLENR